MGKSMMRVVAAVTGTARAAASRPAPRSLADWAESVRSRGIATAIRTRASPRNQGQRRRLPFVAAASGAVTTGAAGRLFGESCL